MDVRSSAGTHVEFRVRVGEEIKITATAIKGASLLYCMRYGREWHLDASAWKGSKSEQQRTEAAGGEKAELHGWKRTPPKKPERCRSLDPLLRPEGLFKTGQ